MINYSMLYSLRLFVTVNLLSNSHNGHLVARPRAMKVILGHVITVHAGILFEVTDTI